MFWILLLFGIVLSWVASIRLRRAYGKHLGARTESGVTGFEAARRILDTNGLAEIPIIETPGHFTDHYDLLKNQLCLSSENYRGKSIASVGIAAHEAGHALQDRDGCPLFRFRVRLIPFTCVVMPLSIVLTLFGLFVNSSLGHIVLLTGLGLFAVVTVFRLATLPVEFDAGRRAKIQLVQLGLVSESETEKISKVLNAAAMTYVAGLVSFTGLFSFKSWK
jgi:Zn-dependent membrane protease YugP